MSDRVLMFLARTEIWAMACAVAGFLFLFWVIRGAPIGQATREEPEDSPSPVYRDRVVGAAVAGFLLVLAGGYLAMAVGIPWSLPVFAAGFGILLTILRVNRRYRHVSPTLRRTLEFSQGAITFSLVAGIIVVGNVVAFRYGGRAYDLTRDQSYSLESQTLNQLRTLDRPVTISVFFGESERSRRQNDRVRQMLDLYQAANPSKVTVEYLDPFNKDLQRYEKLVKDVPEIAALGSDGIVLTYGEGASAPHTVLGSRDLFQGETSRVESGSDRFVSTFNGEDVVTGALIRLREGKRSRVAFTTGHGEPSTGDLDPNQPGLGFLKVRLATIGSDAIEINLLRDDIPADINLLMICGPKALFQAGEIERIQKFLARGGQMVVCVGGNAPTGLEDLLRNYNIEFGPGLAVDTRYNLRGLPYFVYTPIPTGSTHPIVQPVIGRVALLQNASPITPLGLSNAPGAGPASKKPYNPAVITIPFLRTSPESWSETDPTTRPIVRDAAKDGLGPLVVGVGVSARPTTGTENPVPRMVVFSTPLFADNRIVRLEPSNLDLLMNSVQWLRGRPEQGGIPGRTHESVAFAADPGLQLRLVMVPTLMAFVVIIGLGLTTYLARRD